MGHLRSSFLESHHKSHTHLEFEHEFLLLCHHVLPRAVTAGHTWRQRRPPGHMIQNTKTGAAVQQSDLRLFHKTLPCLDYIKLKLHLQFYDSTHMQKAPPTCTEAPPTYTYKLASNPGLPSQLFLQLWKNALFSRVRKKLRGEAWVRG